MKAAPDYAPEDVAPEAFGIRDDPEVAYSVTGQGSKFGSGRDGQDTFVAEPDLGPGLIEAKSEEEAAVFSKVHRAADAGDSEGWKESEVGNTVSAFDNTGPVRAVELVAQPLRSNPHNNSDPGMEASMHIVEDGVADTVRSHPRPHSNGDGGTVLDRKMVVRRLTPLEAERLQGFPDSWTEGFSDTQRYKMLGNAVTVNTAEWIARRIEMVRSRGSGSGDSGGLRDFSEDYT